MGIVEEQPLELKDSVLDSFSKIIEKTMPASNSDEKWVLGKQVAITLVAVASIGLIIGFLISLFV